VAKLSSQYGEVFSAHLIIKDDNSEMVHKTSYKPINNDIPIE
jgi:hypothetical protein